LLLLWLKQSYGCFILLFPSFFIIILFLVASHQVAEEGSSDPRFHFHEGIAIEQIENA